MLKECITTDVLPSYAEESSLSPIAGVGSWSAFFDSKESMHVQSQKSVAAHAPSATLLPTVLKLYLEWTHLYEVWKSLACMPSSEVDFPIVLSNIRWHCC